MENQNKNYKKVGIRMKKKLCILFLKTKDFIIKPLIAITTFKFLYLIILK